MEDIEESESIHGLEMRSSFPWPSYSDIKMAFASVSLFSARLPFSYPIPSNHL
jgi:hypothetical protein